MWSNGSQRRGRNTFSIRQLTVLLLVGLLGWFGLQAWADNGSDTTAHFCTTPERGLVRVVTSTDDCGDTEESMSLATAGGLVDALTRIEAVEVEQSNIVRAVAEQEEEIEILEDTVASAVAEVEGQASVIEDLKTTIDRLEAQTVDQGTVLEALEETLLGLTPPTVAFNSTDDHPDGQLLTMPVEITAPVRGIIIASGTVNAFAGPDFDYQCSLRVDGGIVPGTVMSSELDGAGNSQEDCTTTGAMEVPTGTHTITFNVTNVNAGTSLGNASMWALWVPFDGA